MTAAADQLRKQCDERLSNLFSRLPLTQVLFVRHANTPFAHADAVKRGPASDEDAKRDLGDVGKRQCEDAGRFFGKLDNVSFITHSAAVRCKSTAKLVFLEQCRSRLGNAPIMPLPRAYPGAGPKFKQSSPDYAEALTKAEASFQLLGHVPLKRYMGDPDAKEALQVYAIYALHELLNIVENRLIADQDERFACQVMVFSHGVYMQAVALLMAELLFQPESERDTILNATIGELDVIQVAKRQCKHINASQ